MKKTQIIRHVGASLAIVMIGTTASALDLIVTSVEVTQATQTTNNTILLVAERSTAVRATIGVSGSAVPVGGITGQLHVFVNGTEITPAGGVAPINAPFTAPLSPQRANENDTLNFELPAPTGITASTDVDFQVDVTPVAGETDATNNSGFVSNLTVESRTTPLLFFTRINYTPSGLSLPDLTLVQPGTGDAFVRGILPVNDGDPVLYRQGIFPTLGYGEDADGDGRLEALGGDGSDLLSLLASCRQLIVNSGVGASDRVFLYGWLGGNPINGNGLAQVGGRVAFGNGDPIRHQRSYAHELTHNFGFNHISDNIDEVGWDVGARLPANPAGNNVSGRVKPTSLFDIQVAGLLTPQAWVETAKYNSLLSNATLTTAPDTGDFTARVLVIQGIFEPTGARLRQLKPVFRFPWISRPTVRLPIPTSPPPQVNKKHRRWRPSTTQEQFRVQVVDVNNSVTSMSFEPLVADDPDKTPEREIPGFFEVMVPLSADAASVDVFNIDGARVGGFVRSLPPTLQLTSPLAGQVIGSTTRVAWNVEDPDTPGNQLLFQVAYSPDGGASFVPVAVDQTGNSVVFDATQVAPSRGTGLIRVFVSDGLNTAFADVALLSTGQPPDVSHAFVEPATLWPPNHKFVPLSIEGVTSADGGPVTITVTSIFQDEPVGGSAPDARLAPLAVRSERDGKGNGRVYRINFTAEGSGGTATGSVTVCVPHDQGTASGCGDEGPRFDSVQP